MEDESRAGRLVQPRYNPNQLYSIASGSGYQRGKTTFLAVCAGNLPNFRGKAYGQAYADRSGGRVITSRGELTYTRSGGSVVLRSFDSDGKPAPFLVYTPGGSISYNTSYNTIIIDAKSGETTFVNLDTDLNGVRVKK